MNHNFDVDIHIKPSNHHLIINQEFISVNKQKIACNSVKEIKYGVSLLNAKSKNEAKLYSIDIKNVEDKTLNISFSSTRNSEFLEEDHIYYCIMSALWQYVKKRLVNDHIEILNQNGSFKVGNAEVTQKGIKLPYKKWFLGKVQTGLIEWNDLDHHLNKGNLNIKSLYNSRIKSNLSLHNDWNTVVLNTLLHYIGQEHRKDKLIKGEAI